MPSGQRGFGKCRASKATTPKARRSPCVSRACRIGRYRPPRADTGWHGREVSTPRQERPGDTRRHPADTGAIGPGGEQGAALNPVVTRFRCFQSMSANAVQTRGRRRRLRRGHGVSLCGLPRPFRERRRAGGLASGSARSRSRKAADGHGHKPTAARSVSRGKLVGCPRGELCSAFPNVLVPIRWACA